MNIRTKIRKTLANNPSINIFLRKYLFTYIYSFDNEEKVLKSFNGNFDISVDVGCALGSYALILARKSKEVHCFEPGDKHSTFLKKILPKSNTKLYEYAVGDNNKDITLYTPGDSDDDLFCATLSKSNPASQKNNVRMRTVKQTTLDSHFTNEEIKSHSVDLVKIDVEGYELAVIHGAIKTIKEHKPIIICEIEKRHNSDCEKVFELLYENGYKGYYHYKKEYHEYKLNDMSKIQTDNGLKRMLTGDKSIQGLYINNFIFIHQNSKNNIVKNYL